MKITIASAALSCAVLAMTVPLTSAANAQQPGNSLTIKFEKLRSMKGTLQLCLTKLKEHFPDCSDDPDAVTLSVPTEGKIAEFKNLAVGKYALAVLHDKNSNGRMNKFMGIPKEGIGFSRNPKFSFGPPKFEAALFEMGDEAQTLVVRMKYFL